MCGSVNFDVTSSQSNNNNNISLQRIDSKIKFVVKTKEGVTFTPYKWHIYSVPRKATVIYNENKDLFDYNADNYFNIEERNFDEINENGGLFAFYCLENKINYKEFIKNEGTIDEQYSLREKRIKEEIGNNLYENKEFVYAKKSASYVVIEGYVDYKDSESGNDISAKVKYTILLGGIKDGTNNELDANNYSNHRNCSYTYNITINSVNQIITEVDIDNEVRPGAEGNVTISGEVMDFDSYNNIFKITFKQSEVSDGLTWNVYTPFTKGINDKDIKDYKWILFRINDRNAANSGQFDKRFTFNEEFRKYIGDNKVYKDLNLESANAQAQFYDRYKSDVESYKDSLLTVKHLIHILKESKLRCKNNNNNQKWDMFDVNQKMIFTAYMHDYYYEYDPNDSDKSFDISLWKQFVNTEKRTMSISSDVRLSSDQQSSIFTSLYSFRQSSIITLYNKYLKDSFTAWGVNAIQNKTKIMFDKNTDAVVYDGTSNDSYNGRKNSINLWLKESTSWDYFVNSDTWQMKSGYEYARYKCMSLNRDMNGNGIIEKNEIQWYLSSINQLTDIWIGEPAHEELKLYTHTTWVNDDQWYVSSTVKNSLEVTENKVKKNKNNPEILWSSEGSSIGRLGGSGNINSLVYYRCARNLGIINSESENTVYNDFAHINNDNGTITISLDRLDPGALRGNATVDELPDHNERDEYGNNRPWSKFSVSPTPSKDGHKWEEVRIASQPNSTSRLCDPGWRVPNQRELSLMYSRITPVSFWSLKNHFSRTGFSFYTKSNGRYGFAIGKNADTFFLINDEDHDTGGVRCVRDVN